MSVSCIATAFSFASLRGWASDHGTRVILIVLVAAGAWLLVQRLVPPAMRRALALPSFDGDLVEARKRADTLSHVLVGLADTAIVVMALFLLLGEIGYNLAPVVTGLGIGGIAIGLG